MVYQVEVLHKSCREVGQNLRVDPSTVNRTLTIQCFRKCGGEKVSPKYWNSSFNRDRQDNHPENCC